MERFPQVHIYSCTVSTILELKVGYSLPSPALKRLRSCIQEEAHLLDAALLSHSLFLAESDYVSEPLCFHAHTRLHYSFGAKAGAENSADLQLFPRCSLGWSNLLSDCSQEGTCNCWKHILTFLQSSQATCNWLNALQVQGSKKKWSRLVSSCGQPPILFLLADKLLTHVICSILERHNYTGAQYEGKSELNTTSSSS